MVNHFAYWKGRSRALDYFCFVSLFVSLIQGPQAGAEPLLTISPLPRCRHAFQSGFTPANPNYLWGSIGYADCIPPWERGSTRRLIANGPRWPQTFCAPCQGIEKLELIKGDQLKVLLLGNYCPSDSSANRYRYHTSFDGIPNSVSSLVSLSAHPNLWLLDITGNLVSDLTPLLDLNYLSEVRVAGNPLDSHLGVEVAKQLQSKGVTVRGLENFLSPEPLSVQSERIDYEGSISQSDFPAAFEETREMFGIQDDLLNLLVMNIALTRDVPHEFHVFVESESSELTGYTYKKRGTRVKREDVELLSYLDGTRLGIRSLVGISGLINLRWLYLGNECSASHSESDQMLNKIVSIDELAELKELIEVDLTGNQIQDIRALLELDKLKSVKLSGNPLSRESREVVDELRGKGVSVVLS